MSEEITSEEPLEPTEGTGEITVDTVEEVVETV